MAELEQAAERLEELATWQPGQSRGGRYDI
jgi:hypothetical protein